MSKLSPSELRKRNKAIQYFDEHWYIDTQTYEIRHKQLSIFSRITDLYWWSSAKWYELRLMPYPDAIKRDDVPIIGFPRKHQLKNGWTIPAEDLKYLTVGPLVDESGQKTLVKHQSTIKKTVSVFSQLRPLSWIFPLFLACYRYKNEISDLWIQLSNVI